MSSNMNKFTKDMLRTGDRVTVKSGEIYHVSINCSNSKNNTPDDYMININRRNSWINLYPLMDYSFIAKIERCNPVRWTTIWERKEEPRVTAGEIEAFKAIKVLYPDIRYIARDGDGEAYLYIHAPIKEQNGMWRCVSGHGDIYANDVPFNRDLYPSIKREDDEPVDMDAEIAKAEGQKEIELCEYCDDRHESIETEGQAEDIFYRVETYLKEGYKYCPHCGRQLLEE